MSDSYSLIESRLPTGMSAHPTGSEILKCYDEEYSAKRRTELETLYNTVTDDNSPTFLVGDSKTPAPTEATAFGTFWSRHEHVNLKSLFDEQSDQVWTTSQAKHLTRCCVTEFAQHWAENDAARLRKAEEKIIHASRDIEAALKNVHLSARDLPEL